MSLIPLFVYDDLIDAGIMNTLLKSQAAQKRAVAEGWVLCRDSQNKLFIQHREGRSVEGLLFFLTQEQLWLVDQWKEPCLYSRERITVTSGGLSCGEAWVYNKNGYCVNQLIKYEPDDFRKSKLLEEIKSFHMQTAVSSYPVSDLYIFIPCSIEKEINFVSKRDVPQSAQYYVDQLNMLSRYEFDSNLTRDMERSFLNQVEVICETDDFEVKSELGRQHINLFITWHKNTNIAVVTLAIPVISVSITHLLDQMARGEIFIRDDLAEGGRIKITDWLGYNYGLSPAGTPRSYVNLSRNPETELEMLYLLATEAIGNKVYSKIVGENFKQAARLNIAQYEYSDIYAAETCVVQVFKEFADTYEMRMVRQLLTVFSIELILFQDAAISRVNHKVAMELEKQKQLSSRDAFSIIEELSVEFAKTIVFWDLRNFRYETTQSVADAIARAFKIKELMDVYKSNQTFLEHLVTIHSARMAEQENRYLNGFLLFLAVCQVAPVFYAIILSFINGEVAVSNLIAGISSALTFVIILALYKLFQNRKKRRMKSL